MKSDWGSIEKSRAMVGPIAMVVSCVSVVSSLGKLQLAPVAGREQRLFPKLAAAVIMISSCLLAGLPLAALADESSNVNNALNLADKTSDFVKDYLSDSRRVGSLAGSVIGGALTAHPFGPVLGGVVGFFIGKQTMFEERPETALPQFVNPQREIIAPPQGTIATLSFDNPAGITFPTPGATTEPVPVAVPVAPAVAVLERQQSVAIPAVARSPVTLSQPQQAYAIAQPMSREQLASLCGVGGGRADPRLKGVCFYYSAD